MIILFYLWINCQGVYISWKGGLKNSYQPPSKILFKVRLFFENFTITNLPFLVFTDYYLKSFNLNLFPE